jgi:hypothetical protein
VVFVLPAAVALLVFAHLRELAAIQPVADLGPSYGPASALLTPMIAHVLTASGLFLSFLTLAGFAVGIGLLTLAPWGRMLAIVGGVLALIHIPFGTALGAYTLWVLLPAESETQYRALSEAHAARR